MLGDLCLAAEVERRILSDPAYRPLGALESMMSERDRLVANVECDLTERDKPMPLKAARLKANPVMLLCLGRLDIAVLGNNHVGDFGEDGAADTVASLARHGIQPVGFGANLEEALRPSVVELEGYKLGIVALCCPTTNSPRLRDTLFARRRPTNDPDAAACHRIRTSGRRRRPRVPSLGR